MTARATAQTDADTIKNAVTAGANTATRVGTMLRELTDGTVFQEDAATTVTTTTKAAGVVGTAVTFAREDHKHDVSTAAAVTLDGTSTSAEGVATSLARSDHTHTLSLATSTVAGIQAAADKQQRDRFFNDGPRSLVYLKDDFDQGGAYTTSAASVPNGVVFGEMQWRAGVAGTAAAITYVQTNVDATHHGVIELNTGTTTTGLSIMSRNPASATPMVVIGSGQVFTFEGVIRVPTLSDGTNTYSFTIGWGSNVTGMIFRYDSTVSANWLGITGQGGTTTTASGGTNVAVAAGAWIRLTITWDGTTASFYVNGTLIGTSTTNIPTGLIAEALNLTKSAGTTARTVLVDLIWVEKTWTSPRAA